MGMTEWKCSWCKQSRYLFEGEQKLTIGGCLWQPGRHFKILPHHWEKMPPKISVVLATTGLMLDEPQLDSLITIYELDRQLNLEARDEIEMEIYQRARRNA